MPPKTSPKNTAQPTAPRPPATQSPAIQSATTQPTGVDFHTRSLKYLKAIAEHGTFAKASEALSVSQPAISQSIAAFERQLGVTLLESQGKRKVLTQAGRRLADFSGEVLGLSHELRRWLDAYEQGRAGSLRVGMIDTALLYQLPAAVEAYPRLRPEVDLQIFVAESGTLLERLDSFDLDLAFLVEPAPPQTVATPIVTERLHVYASKSARAANSWALPPGDSRTRGLIDQGLGRLGVAPHVSLESRNPVVLGQMASLGTACTVLPEALAAQTPELKKLRGELVCERTLLAVQRASGGGDERAAEFIQLAQRGVAAGGRGGRGKAV